MKSTFAQRLATLPPLTMRSPAVTRAIAEWDQIQAAVNDPGFLDRLERAIIPPVVDKDFTPRLDDAFEAVNGEDPERWDADFDGQRN